MFFPDRPEPFISLYPTCRIEVFGLAAIARSQRHDFKLPPMQARLILLDA